jgi:hypothetical protein
MNTLLVGLVAILAIAYVLAIVLCLVERRRQVRRMHEAREANSMEFGALEGPRFERCTACGHVRHG